MRDAEISPDGSKLVQTWFEFRGSQIKVPNSCDFGPSALLLADIDNDDQVEIVLGHHTPNAQIGALTVYGDLDKTWPPGRKVWNQHTYNITNTVRVV